MKRTRVAVLSALAAAVFVTAGEPSASGQTEPRAQQPSYRVQVVKDNLTLPWGMDFLPNGNALVTERDSGRLLVVEPSGDSRTVQRLPERGDGEGGLLGVAVSPNYEKDRLVYAYYSTGRDNRVARFRLGEKPRPIVTGIPVASSHNGGRIAFGPGGNLYIATGDARQEGAAQNKRSLAGKILRVRPDGGTARNNPFGNRVYSYGHRNVQGLAWDAKGRMYATEFGQNTYDEINRIKRGANYGWPNVEGRENNPRYKNPVAVFRPEVASPSGMAIPKNGKLENFNGDILAAALRGERLLKLERNDRGMVTDKSFRLKGTYGRLRHVEQAPDGSLWVLTSNGDNDRILRLAPRR